MLITYVQTAEPYPAAQHSNRPPMSMDILIAVPVFNPKAMMIAYRRKVKTKGISWSETPAFLGSITAATKPVSKPQPTIWENEMSHLMTKPTKWHVRPAKTQISLDIRPVWSEA